MAQVTPQLSGQAIAIHVRDTQSVKRGDVLVELDPVNAQIAVAQAEADLAQARRHFRQALANNDALGAQVSARGSDIASAQSRLAAAKADDDKAEGDLAHRQALAASGAVSGDELGTARHAAADTKAMLDAARAGVNQARASKSSAQGQLAANDALVRGSSEASDPAVLAAAARLQAARIDLDHTTIRAPIDGVVTRRQVQLGQRIMQGAPIMTIVPLAQVYIDANFKEGQLSQVRLGMPAKVVTDLYGNSVVFHGTVAGIAAGTGASQALIPAQNATGNWIKVVQRLPVRIALVPAELVAHPLQVGLSSEVTINLTGK